MDNRIRFQFDAYIKKTCRNILVDYMRKKNRENKNLPVTTLFDESLEYVEPGFELAESLHIIISGYDVQITDLDLYEAINRLPKRHKEALILNVIAKMPCRKIAALFGVTERTVMNYKKAAIHQIRKEMSNEQKL